MTGFNLYQVLLKASTVDVESEIAPEHEDEFSQAYDDLTRTLRSKELDQIFADQSNGHNLEEELDFGEMIRPLIQQTPEGAGGETQSRSSIATDVELKKQLQKTEIVDPVAKKLARLRSLLQNPDV